MCSIPDDSALIYDDNSVGILHGPQTVGDDHGGATAHHLLQRTLNLRFCKWIDTGCGFIEDEDGGIF